MGDKTYQSSLAFLCLCNVFTIRLVSRLFARFPKTIIVGQGMNAVEALMSMRP